MSQEKRYHDNCENYLEELNSEICFIKQKGERFYLLDKCGRWRITEEMFNYLKEKEILIYGVEIRKTIQNY